MYDHGREEEAAEGGGIAGSADSTTSPTENTSHSCQREFVIDHCVPVVIGCLGDHVRGGWWRR